MTMIVVKLRVTSQHELAHTDCRGLQILIECYRNWVYREDTICRLKSSFSGRLHSICEISETQITLQ